MKKRIVAFLLSAAMVFTNIMPAMADTTVIDLSSEAAELMQEDDLQDPDQDTVSTNDQEEVSDIEEDTMLDENLLNRPVNGTISSGTSYGFAEGGLCHESENDIDADRSVSYPAKFDPRPAGVSGARHQYLGSCWAYSALAAAESNLIKKGYTDSSIDLSEFQLIYFMNHENIDPLGNYTKDTKDSGKTMTELFNQGGSPKAAVSFLSKWTGPVLESQAPVIRTALPGGGWVDEADQMDAVVLGQELCANSSNWHFKGAKYCDYDVNHIDNIKELITNYGGVSMCYYDDGKHYSYTCPGEGEDANYYFAYKAAANHAVEIVGWDDNYSKENFKHAGTEKLPEADGAWLVKNSWAEARIPDPYVYNEAYKSSGYFWLSYYDKTICEIIALEYDSKDTYANMYAYDGAGVGLAGSGGTTYLNIYKAKAYDKGTVERIDGVMTYLAANMPYTLTIYVNPVVENGKLISYSGKSEAISGCSDYEGFYTFDISDKNIYVPDGMTYGICIETAKAKADNGVAPVGIGGYYQEAGQSYYGYSLYSLNDYATSEEYKAAGAAVCLRGLTNKASSIVLSESVSLETYSLSLKEGKTATVVVDEVLPENTTNKTCSFYSTDESVATVDETGKVTAVGYGECDIVVTAYDGMSSDTCHVTVYCTGLSLADQQLLVNRVCTIDPVYKNGYKGITSEQLSWESSDPDTATVDSMGRVTAHATGTVTITASIKDPVVTSNRLVKASCKVTIGRMAESIKTDADTVTLYEGETHQITAEVLPSDTTDKGLTYSCIRESIAKVSATGLITAVSEGTTTVTLTAMDGSGITKDITVTVLPAIKTIDVYNGDITLQAEDTYTTYFNAYPSTEGWRDRIRIASSDPSVADVGQVVAGDIDPNNGMAVITAKKAGACVITIAGDKVSVSFQVTVTAKPGTPTDNTNAGNTGGNTGNNQNQVNNGNVKKPAPVGDPDPVMISTGSMQFKVNGVNGSEVTLIKMTGKGTKASIPGYVKYNGKSYKVTKIADKAFYKNTKLKTVTIPSTVTEIGSKAFYGCKKLTKVTIPNKVRAIGSKAFYGCKKITKVTVKSTKLNKVGSKAFTGISKKAVIKVPKKKLAAYTKLLKGKYTKGVKIKK